MNLKAALPHLVGVFDVSGHVVCMQVDHTIAAQSMYTHYFTRRKMVNCRERSGDHRILKPSQDRNITVGHCRCLLFKSRDCHPRLPLPSVIDYAHQPCP